jgi:hypothetical protein
LRMFGDNCSVSKDIVVPCGSAAEAIKIAIRQITAGDWTREAAAATNATQTMTAITRI